MSKALLIALVVLLSACGATHKLRKADRLIKQAIALGAVVKADTVYSESIVYKKGDSTTVFVPVKQLKDTVIYKDRIKTSIRIVRDTLKVHVECPSDTIKIKVPVTVTRTIMVPPSDKWKIIALTLSAVLILLVSLGLLLKYR